VKHYFGVTTSGEIKVVGMKGKKNEDYFEIAKRAIANYGRIFDYDEREVAWGVIRLLGKDILSSIFIGPAEDLPKIGSSTVSAIKTVKVNNDTLVADALANDDENSMIVTLHDTFHSKARSAQLYMF
jgi:hypothetical protein